MFRGRPDLPKDEVATASTDEMRVPAFVCSQCRKALQWLSSRLWPVKSNCQKYYMSNEEMNQIASGGNWNGGIRNASGSTAQFTWDWDLDLETAAERGRRRRGTPTTAPPRRDATPRNKLVPAAIRNLLVSRRSACVSEISKSSQGRAERRLGGVVGNNLLYSSSTK